jgi:S1-C subfamily serine protease
VALLAAVLLTSAGPASSLVAAKEARPEARGLAGPRVEDVPAAGSRGQAAAGRVTVAENGLRPRGVAGFAYRDLLAGEADSLGLSDAHGVAVTAVFPGAAAAAAGIRPGDVVRAYGLHLIADCSALSVAARSFSAGDTVP